MRRVLQHHLLATLALVVIGHSVAAADPLQGQPAPTGQPATTTYQPLAPPTAGELKSVGSLVDDASPAGKLRDLLAGDISRLITRKDDRPAVETFYRERGFAPLWSANGAPNARAKAVVAYLRGVGADGLDPSDYPAPAFADQSPQAQAEDDLKLTNSVLAFARHARTGRVSYTRISQSIRYDLQYPDPAEVLGRLAETEDVRGALDSYLPQHPGYKALKAKLAELRGGSSAARIEKGPALRLAAKKKGQQALMQDPRVPALRARLGLPANGNTNYDQALADAVKKFQKARQLPANGELNAATVDALNGAGGGRRIGPIIATLERWRWMPRDLGPTHVVVNIPDYTLRVVDQGKTAWSTRVVVGKPGEMATPLFSETMKYITVNPTWNVPPSIIRNEYLPALQRDPDALARSGLKIKRRPDGSLHVYQPPGPRNALGRIRFNFPNQFLVYQHDTPNKHLFARAERAYSHGCMRVQDPEQYAEVLLSLTQPKDKITAERIRKLYGDSERTINLKTPVPVHLTYQTAFVDESGQLQFRRDVYGRDEEILRVLRDERAVADLPVGRRYNAGSKPVMARALSSR
jgi:murein L,D-transpeptidase YcbB/YkuD